MELVAFKDDQKTIPMIMSPHNSALDNKAFVWYSILIIYSLAQKSLDTAGNTLNIVFFNFTLLYTESPSLLQVIIDAWDI